MAVVAYNHTKNCYLHAGISKSLNIYNFCYESARDLISFLVDQTYEFNIENVKNIENRPRIMAAGCLKHFF